VIDLMVRGGTVVRGDAASRINIAIDGERIVEVGDSARQARDTIDATGLVIMPGIVDVHVHFNEPGRVHWEGAATGSAALAAGGGTLFFDMPLNSTPCTVSIEAFDQKRAALERSSVTDFGIWGGLVPAGIDAMEPLAARGVVGFKAFMCHSGLAEFPAADDRTLHDGLCEAARLGLPVAVHAESERLLRGRRTVSALDWLRSRPVDAEVDAIERVTRMAGEAGARLHIVHVSSGRGVAAAAAARRRGVDVSIETCPHYLTFTEDDIDRLGTAGKCAPPVRDGSTQQALWSALLARDVDIVGSDHSPTEPALKQGDFSSAWGGIAGVQSTLPVLVDRGRDAGLPLAAVAGVLATNPARRFGIAHKGRIEPGYDADLVLVDPQSPWTLSPRHLHQRHKTSPYVGMRFTTRVRRTILRGRTIYIDDQVIAGPGTGLFVRPMDHQHHVSLEDRA
jgi:allantoinase